MSKLYAPMGCGRTANQGLSKVAAQGRQERVGKFFADVSGAIADILEGKNQAFTLLLPRAVAEKDGKEVGADGKPLMIEHKGFQSWLRQLRRESMDFVDVIYSWSAPPEGVEGRNDLVEYKIYLES